MKNYFPELKLSFIIMFMVSCVIAQAQDRTNELKVYTYESEILRTDKEDIATALPVLDMQTIKNLLETNNPIVYALDADGLMTKAYTYSSKGFWLTSDGYVARYGNFTKGEIAAFAFVFVDDHLDIYRRCRHSLEGHPYRFECYFVNESSGKFITIVSTITFINPAIQDFKEIGRHEVSDIMRKRENIIQ